MNPTATPRLPPSIPIHSAHTSCRSEAQVDDAIERAKCLVVEEHPAQLAALAAALRKPDRETFIATSAAEAMSLSREHDFAFVLLDLQIPTLDGYALAEMMRGAERSSATPIVLMSA